jgi:hypothetical protein
MRRIFNLLHKVVILLGVLAVIIEDEPVKKGVCFDGAVGNAGIGI